MELGDTPHTWNQERGYLILVEIRIAAEIRDQPICFLGENVLQNNEPKREMHNNSAIHQPKQCLLTPYCYSKSWNVFLVKLKIHTWTGNFIVCCIHIVISKSNADKFKNFLVVLLMSFCTKFDYISFKTIANMFVCKSLCLLNKSYMLLMLITAMFMLTRLKTKQWNMLFITSNSVQIKLKFFYWCYWKKSV